uniref:Uncharacterized protein n=1 Tax=Anguilla anguilla TaxID=7936 RepID=A0A0E9V5G9_ANGAN
MKQPLPNLFTNDLTTLC